MDLVGAGLKNVHGVYAVIAAATASLQLQFPIFMSL
jgi:hypothetical protein